MVINLITDLTNSVILSLEKTKEVKQQEHYDIIDKELDDLIEKLDYIQSTEKKEYILNEGLKNELSVKNRRLNTKRIYKYKEVIGFDVETYKGKAKLICCSHSKSLLDSKDKPLTFLKAIQFLFKKADNTGIYRFFYNLDFDFSAILKLWNSNIKVLQKRILRKIKWLKNGIEVNFYHYKNNKTNRICYKLRWIKGRMLTIKHYSRRKRIVFTDIFNFFKIGLNKSSEKYLSNVKIDDIDGNLLNTSIDYWNKREADIIKYCIQDSILTKDLGVVLIKAIEKVGLPLPKYLVSSASLSKHYFRLNGFIPKICHIPENILQISYDCYFGGRFEMFKRGTFDKLFLYDIVSQYPSFIKDLLSMRDGLWKKVNYFPEKECLGFFRVKLDIPKDYIIPTIPIKHNGVNKFPTGIIEKWLTWYDLDLVQDYIFEVKEGFVFYESALCKSNKLNNHRPFKEKIELLFKKKQELKGKSELDYNIVKLCMNALYGCFIEVHKNYQKDDSFNLKAGMMFNSVYASQITAFGRWSVIKDIPKELYKNIIAIHTDSIISDIPLDLDIGKELGQWNLEKEGKGLIINTGMYQIDDLIKTRGIPKKFIKNWFTFCKENSRVKSKSFKIVHMRKLAEGLVRDKSLKNVNTMMDDVRSVNCNSDTKRDWLNNFKNFKEVLETNIDSYPFYSFDDYKDLHPNPLAIAYRYENK